MAACLIALGSNLGEREAAIEEALREIDSFPLSRLVRASRFHSFAPIGGPADQGDFLNAAALVETDLAPQVLFAHLIKTEVTHCRERTKRWAARTLDLDLLLYDDQIIETASLIVPHPRMSFRRFVLEPAAEIAPDMIVPTIGWPIRQLLDYLNTDNDLLAVVSHSAAPCLDLCRALTTRYGATVVGPATFPTGSPHSKLWPPAHATWMSVAPTPTAMATSTASKRQSSVARLPKLTILIDPGGTDPASTLALFERGPTLHLKTLNQAAIDDEVSAALASVWPHLGRQDTARIQ